MDVRSLAIKLGFKLDRGSVSNATSSIENVKDKLNQAGNAADRMGDSASRGVRRIASASNVSSRLLDKLSSSADNSKNSVDGLVGKLNNLLAFAGVSFTLGSLIKTIDEWKVIEGQVNNVTKNEKESKAVQNEIYNIASRTRQQYGSTAELFTSVARNAQELKKSTKDVLLFTEDVSNAMLLGGGAADSQKAALVQLGQALGSGVLRGDELNSILEQAPRLAKAIAEGMGTTIGNLRQMGQEGKLTAQDVFKAIRSQSDRLKMELGKMPWTVGQASNKMQNAIGKFFKEFEDKTGIIDGLAKKMAEVATYIERINLNNFIAGFRMVAIYAGVLFAMSKWGKLVMAVTTVTKWVIAMKNAFLLAAGANVVFQSQTKRVAALQMLMLGKFLLIAAAITLLVLGIQDFYKWITDPTADSMMKRWVGDFDSVSKKANDFISMLENSPVRFVPFIGVFLVIIEVIRDLYRWFIGGNSVIGNAVNNWQATWQGFCDYIKNAWQAFSDFFDHICKTNIFTLIQEFMDWLGKLGNKIVETARSWGEFLKNKFGDAWWPTIKAGAGNFIQQGVHGAGPAAPADLVGRYGHVGLTSSTSNISNSGNTTNYVTVNTASTSPEATGKAVANAVPHSNGLGSTIDSSNPNFAF